METKMITLDDPVYEQNLEEAARLLRRGALVAFPTETVYGLGANGLDAQAVASIYTAKGRPSDNPLILHVSDVADVKKYVAEISPRAQKIMDVFCPGPITLILKRKSIVPNVVTAGLDTVGVRVPSHPVARDLIRKVGLPIAAPSANLSGRPSPTSAQAVWEDLNGRIAAVVYGENCEVGLESTIIDCTGDPVTILRPGAVTLEMLQNIVGPGHVREDGALSNGGVPKAPGMKYRHYAPNAPLTLFEGEAQKVEQRLKREVQDALALHKRIGAVVSEETARMLPEGAIVRIYGRRGDTAAIASRLYAALRSFDSLEVEQIFAEGLEKRGLGMAVMNRMQKASGQRIVRLH